MKDTFYVIGKTYSHFNIYKLYPFKLRFSGDHINIEYKNLYLSINEKKTLTLFNCSICLFYFHFLLFSFSISLKALNQNHNNGVIFIYLF